MAAGREAVPTARELEAGASGRHGLMCAEAVKAFEAAGLTDASYLVSMDMKMTEEQALISERMHWEPRNGGSR